MFNYLPNKKRQIIFSRKELIIFDLKIPYSYKLHPYLNYKVLPHRII